MLTRYATLTALILASFLSTAPPASAVENPPCDANGNCEWVVETPPKPPTTSTPIVYPPSTGGGGGPQGPSTPPPPDPWDIYDACMATGTNVCAVPLTPRGSTPTGPGAPTVTPGQVAQMAVARLTMGAPEIGMAPRPGTRTFVGMPTWFWAWDGESPVLTTSASAGGLTVNAKATIDHTTWRFGDGKVRSCAGVGTKFVPAPKIRRSPTCDHIYEAMGDYTVTAEAVWTVTWNGAISGSTTIVRSSTIPVNVEEVQVLVKAG